MRQNVKGTLFILAAAVLWSFGGLLIKFVPWDAMTVAGLRAAFAALVTALYMRRVRLRFSRPMVLAALSLAATTVLFVFANKLTTAANAIVLQYTAPIFVLIMTAAAGKQRPALLDVVSVLVVFAGIVLFFFDRLEPDSLLGSVLAVLAGVAFAGVFFFNKLPGAHPVDSVMLGHLINAVVAVPFIVRGVSADPAAWGAVALLGVFQLGVAYVLFSVGIRTTPPVSASLICTLEPLLNPLWVFLVLGEMPGRWALAGGAVVLAAVVFHNVRSARRQAASAKKQPGLPG